MRLVVLLFLFSLLHVTKQFASVHASMRRGAAASWMNDVTSKKEAVNGATAACWLQKTSESDPDTHLDAGVDERDEEDLLKKPLFLVRFAAAFSCAFLLYQRGGELATLSGGEATYSIPGTPRYLSLRVLRI